MRSRSSSAFATVFGFLVYRAIDQPTLVERTGSASVSRVDRSNRLDAWSMSKPSTLPLTSAQTRLLSAVAKNLGLSIEQLDIHRGYSPRGWFDLEAEQAHIRQLAIEIADGKRALHVMSWDGEKYKPNKAQ